MSERTAITHAACPTRRLAQRFCAAIGLCAVGVALAAAAPAADQPPTVSVTITGTATGPDEQPVKGATVYMMAVEWPQVSKVIATATTDDKGAYEFRDQLVPRPMEGEEKEPSTIVYVHVCALAPGLAFAWHPEMRLALPGAYAQFPAGLAAANNYRTAAEPQRVDLKFAKSEEYVGHAVDDRGRPVAGVTVRLRASSDAKLVIADLPGAPFTATTGPDGRFRLGGIPHGFIASLEITHPDFTTFGLAAANATRDELSQKMKLPEQWIDNLFWTGELNLTLAPPRTVSLQVVSDKTGEPVRDIQVHLSSTLDKISMSEQGTTDAAGRNVLRVPPGEYHLGTQAPSRTNYLRLADKVTVTATPAEQSRTVRVVPGCTVEIEAVDADTGRPVPRLLFEHFRQEPGAALGSWATIDDDAMGYIHTGLVRGGMGAWGKQTNRSGRLTAVLEPGKSMIRPESPFVAVGEIKPVELPAGETVKLRILVREQK